MEWYIAICLLQFCLFFRNSFHSYFLGKFALKIWSSSNWLKIGTEVDSYMLISILIFIFSKFLSFLFFGQIWSQNLKFSKLIEIWYRCTLLSAYYDFNVYFFKIFVIHIFGQIWSQNLKFSKLIEIWYTRPLL